jgi:hypothetical protein
VWLDGDDDDASYRSMHAEENVDSVLGVPSDF